MLSGINLSGSVAAVLCMGHSDGILGLGSPAALGHSLIREDMAFWAEMY